MTRLRNITLLICSLSVLYGCAIAWLGVGAGVGIGAYKYIEGRLERDYPLPYSRAWNATNSALESLRISISTSTDNKTKGTIDAVRRDGKKVHILLKDRGQGVTRISVRVGMLGDRSAAEKVHDNIASAAGVR